MPPLRGADGYRVKSALGHALAALAVVLAALAPLAPAAQAADAGGRVTRARLVAMRAAIARHQSATGELPSSVKQLAVVARLYAPQTPMPRGLAVDGWQQPFVYQLAAELPQGYLLYSMGENRRDESGNGDDLGAEPRAQQDSAGPPISRALQLLPVLSLFAVAPFALALIRSARRDLR